MTNDKTIEATVVGFLDSTEIPYEVVGIDPDFADTAEFCEKYDFPLENSANTIIVASKKKPKRSLLQLYEPLTGSM